MGYMSISNLYADQTILLFKECWALEKIHGTSAHLSWRDGKLSFSPGGEKHDNFVNCFDVHALSEAFNRMGHASVVVFGEAYGGKQQRQAWRYGPTLKFVAFEVKVGDHWLNVPAAHDVCTKLGIEFVDYIRTSTDLAALDAARNAPSTQAKRNGIVEDQPREGVVLRPIVEMRLNNGERIIAKHKRDEERETKTVRHIDVDPAKQQRLTEAEAIADEYVTEGRLANAKTHFQADQWHISNIKSIIDYMANDVVKEHGAEITMTPEAHKAIGRKTVALFKKMELDAAR